MARNLIAKAGVFFLSSACLPVFTSTAHAQDAAEEENVRSGGFDIIVTAQKREEALQDVPITIQAFTAETMQASGVSEVIDLPALVPALTIGRSAGGTVPFIRGVGSTDTAAGQESPVSTYIDGVYVMSMWANNAALKNVERVEVLKGPQGTLFGRNATGGLIHIITRDPEFDTSGSLSLSAGAYETYEVNGYFTTGLTETIAADFAGYVRRQEDGYGINLVTGNDTNFNNEITARSKIQYQGERTKFTLAGDYTDIEDARGLNRTILPGTISTGGGTYSGDFYDVTHNVDFKRTTESGGVSLQIDHEFGSVDLTSISAYRVDDSNFYFDNDIGATPAAVADIYYKNKTISQELRLASANASGNSWITGLYYFHADSDIDLSVLAGPALTPVANIVSNVETNSYSLFGEYRIGIGNNGRLTLGARYTIDERTTGGTVGAIVFPGQKETWKQPSWRVVYDHHITDDAMVYASYNRGFKSGNFNIIPANQPSYDPEIVDAYEIGTKISSATARFNLAAFYYDYRDLQVRIIQNVSTMTLNAASANIWGIEGDFAIELLSGFTVSGGAAYVDSEYSDFGNAPNLVPATPGVYCPGVTTGPLPSGGNCVVAVDASGNQLIRSPKFTGNIGADYRIPVGEGSFSLNARLSYRGGFPWEVSGRIREDDSLLLNASLFWNAPGNTWRLGFRGRNILADKYQIYGGSVEAGDYLSAGEPSTYAIVAEFNF